MNIKAPWLDFYGNIPKTLEYPDVSMFELIEMNAGQWPYMIAYSFEGRKKIYKDFLNETIFA